MPREYLLNLALFSSNLILWVSTPTFAGTTGFEVLRFVPLYRAGGLDIAGARKRHESFSEPKCGKSTIHMHVTHTYMIYIYICIYSIYIYIYHDMIYCMYVCTLYMDAV